MSERLGREARGWEGDMWMRIKVDDRQRKQV